MNVINWELIKSKMKNLKDDVRDLKDEFDDLEKTVKNEYTPLSTTRIIDSRVAKFESLWDWALKLVFGAIIISLLALIGLK